jgi:hypothetical protein
VAAAAPAIEPVAAPVAPRFDPAASRGTMFDAQEDFRADFDEPPQGRSRRLMWVAIGVVLIAAMGAGIYASRFFGPAPEVPTDTGTLVITTNPPGAQAIVDGTAQGVTPLTLTLPAGAHQVELRGGGEPRTLPITITAGKEVAQYVDLPKPASGAGQLQVKSEPSGARVSVDGTPRGTAPVLVSNLPPGEHTVVVESDLGTVKQTVTVESGATAALVVPLGTPASGPASGWVSVTAPMVVQLYENGQLIGSSQSDRVMVTAGRHDLEIVNEALGFRATQSVQVPAGKVSPVNVDVPKGTIALNAQPWAEVWIDGEKIGETPIGNYSIAIGTHDVLFRHPEFGEQHYSTTVTLKAPARLSVDMRKK